MYLPKIPSNEGRFHLEMLLFLKETETTLKVDNKTKEALDELGFINFHPQMVW